MRILTVTPKQTDKCSSERLGFIDVLCLGSLSARGSKSLCPVSREDDQPSVSDGEDLQGLEGDHSESAFDFDALWVVSL